MYTPINTPIIGSLAPVDLSLHTFLGISWHILLPYTALGALLMVYSQSRLIRGQRSLKRAEAQAAQVK